jgi:hypothetical protein
MYRCMSVKNYRPCVNYYQTAHHVVLSKPGLANRGKNFARSAQHKFNDTKPSSAEPVKI